MSKATVSRAPLVSAMARKRHGVKQAAYEAGMNWRTFYGYMNGATPSLTAACKLADYCECGLDDLVRWPE